MLDTPVRDESVREVRGGQKKRASIAETMATHARHACRDNSTRGLNASITHEFVRALHIATNIAHATTMVTIYQAPESHYQLFDKVCIRNAGRQIYYGPADDAKQYFVDMGWQPANRQTTANFLVSVTDPLARTPREGWEDRVPRTADEFAARWTEKGKKYKESARAERATTVSRKSAYTVSIMMQVRGIMLRRVQILRGDLTAQIGTASVFLTQALIMGSVFLKMAAATSAFFSRGDVLFFSVLFGTLSSMLLSKHTTGHSYVHEDSYFNVNGGTRGHAHGQAHCKVVTAGYLHHAAQNAGSHAHFVDSTMA
ncbi:hypothetical protein FRC07_007621, partial [Ceratobasidium sp. 392]